MAKTTWAEKLEAKDKELPKIDVVKDTGMERWGAKIGEKFVVPHPKDVYEVMSKVPNGKVITIAEIRESLATKYQAKIACPLTSGIFAWISAHAAVEKKDTEMPWWRTLKTGGFLNEKFPGDTMTQKSYLESEGHKVVQKGKKYLVENSNKKIFKP